MLRNELNRIQFLFSLLFTDVPCHYKKAFSKECFLNVSAGAAVMCKQQIVFALGGLMLGVLLLRVDEKQTVDRAVCWGRNSAVSGNYFEYSGGIYNHCKRSRQHKIGTHSKCGMGLIYL